MRLGTLRSLVTLTSANLALCACTNVCAATPAALLQESGTEVDSIRGIESLTDWITLDTQNLTLRVNHAEHYLLTLKNPCEHLRGAQLVGVSMNLSLIHI